MPDALASREAQELETPVEGLKPRIEEVPFLKEDHAELGALVQQIDSLITQTDVHEGRLREATARSGDRREPHRRALRPHGRRPQGQLRQARQRAPRVRPAAQRPAWTAEEGRDRPPAPAPHPTARFGSGVG